MEIFFPRLPDNSRRSTQRSVANAIHNVFTDKIAFEWRQVGKNNRQGVLTFPTLEIGKRFLNQYQSGLRWRDHSGRSCNVDIRLSNREPNSRLIEGLQRAMEEITKASDSEQDIPRELDISYVTPRSDVNYFTAEIRCKWVEWGVWTSEGEFGQCGIISRGKPRIVYSPETGELYVVDIGEVYSENGIKSGITINNVIIQEIFIHRDGVHTRLFLSLDRIPQFWSENSTRHTSEDVIDNELLRLTSEVFGSFRGPDDRCIYRIPALCSEHAPHAPYCTVYAFELEGPNLHNRLKQLFKSMKRVNPAGTSTQITTVPFNLTLSLDQLASLYSSHHYRVAFQMESLVRNCYLLPSEVISLNDYIHSCEQRNGIKETVRVLQSFASALPFHTLESIHSLDLIKLLEAKQIPQRFTQLGVDQNAAWIHRLDITPAAYNMEGPEWMGSNRVLRLFPEHHDYFLKVAFVEEDLFKIRQTRDLNIFPVLRGRWGAALQDKISIAGRQFHFLGFSGSSLREHSAWFLAPFKYNDKIITAELLRSELGDFSHIRCPPRLGSRLGQTFTTTTHSLELAPHEVGVIEDVSRGPYIFSDGVGTMSQAMLDRIWSATSIDDNEIKPVVYQIRLGGSKGVISLDKTISGCQILLRPSMTKFLAPNTHLELVNKGKPLPFFLNRNLIVVLESLNLPQQNFLHLLDEEIGHLEKASGNFEDAFQLVQRYGLGHASRLPKILRTLERNGFNAIFEIPFFRELNSLALTHALKQLKYKSRVPVATSWKLIGVMDEFRHLKEGEIYVCIKDERDASVRTLKGNTMVTRSPTLHCGDVQIVRAIGSVATYHPLSSLYNCIVFSSEGPRPIPNMLAGGDLDGDIFDVSQNPLLFPPNRVHPDSWSSATPQDLVRQCTIDDVTKFFLDFIANDNIGPICSRHSILADQSPNGALRPECVQYSRLASVAIDFPKTGIPVSLQNAPYVNVRIKPDFMAQQPLNERDFVPKPPSHTSNSPDSPNYSGIRPDRTYYYKSQKILGKMYRGVDIQTLLRKWNTNSDWNEKGTMQVWDHIEHNLQKLDPPYQTTWSDDIQEAKAIFVEYMKDLEWIQWYFHPTQGGKRLSEAEVFLQSIRIDPSVRFVRGRGKDDYIHGLRQAYGGLVACVRSAVKGQSGGRYRRAAACFYVGIGDGDERTEGESFAWVVVPELFEAWKQVEENGFVDEILGDSTKESDIGPSQIVDSGPHEYDNADRTLRDIMGRFGVVGL